MPTLMLAMEAKILPCALTHDPQTVHRNFGMKSSDAVFPPVPGFRVGEVRKGRRTRPNLGTHNEVMLSKSPSKGGKLTKNERNYLTFPIKICPEEFLMKTSRFNPSSNGE